jgi:hypothetical protein
LKSLFLLLHRLAAQLIRAFATHALHARLARPRRHGQDAISDHVRLALERVVDVSDP